MIFFYWENDDKHLDFGVPHSQTHACYLISIVVNPSDTGIDDRTTGCGASN